MQNEKLLDDTSGQTVFVMRSELSQGQIKYHMHIKAKRTAERESNLQFQ